MEKCLHGPISRRAGVSQADKVLKILYIAIFQRHTRTCTPDQYRSQKQERMAKNGYSTQGLVTKVENTGKKNG